MQRVATGHYEIARTAGESVRSFVPDPLPPHPSLDMGGLGQALKDRVLLACGRLDGVSDCFLDRGNSVVAVRPAVVRA
jgi:hypothetical protein